MKGNNISRRQLLRKTAATTIGAMGFPYIVSSTVLGKDGVAPSNRITVGCIGVGGRGTRVMKDFLQNSDVQVLAVCDANKEGHTYGGSGDDTAGREPAKRIVEDHYAKQKAVGTYKGCDSCVDFRDVLARDDIDAVMIGTPDHWHAVISVAAARAGKDIYCEKPLAYTIAEGRAVCDAVKRNDVIFQTGSQQRSMANSRTACELVRNGYLGKVHTAKVGFGKAPTEKLTNMPGKEPAPVPAGFDYDMWVGPAPVAQYSKARCHFWWRWVNDYGRGTIGDWAGHHGDIAQWGLGVDRTSAVEIEGKGTLVNDSLYGTFDQYHYECKYKNGLKMIVSSDFPRGVTFEGAEGSVYVMRWKLSAKPSSLLDTIIGPDGIHLAKSSNHVHNFLDSVKARSQAIEPAEVGHRAAMIGHLGIIAMTVGGKLKFDPEKERFTNSDEANRLLSRPMRGPWHL